MDFAFLCAPQRNLRLAAQVKSSLRSGEIRSRDRAKSHPQDEVLISPTAHLRCGFRRHNSVDFAAPLAEQFRPFRQEWISLFSVLLSEICARRRR
ncbi:MAG: hypothetical protein IJE66_02485 [Akkermansia sp.]|nr:hypothetical protein [Akkermansia sp.]